MLDRLQNRLIELQKQRTAAQVKLQQANADVIAICGAIQEIEYQISLMKHKEGDTECPDSQTV